MHCSENKAIQAMVWHIKKGYWARDMGHGPRDVKNAHLLHSIPYLTFHTSHHNHNTIMRCQKCTPVEFHSIPHISYPTSQSWDQSQSQHNQNHEMSKMRTCWMTAYMFSLDTLSPAPSRASTFNSLICMQIKQAQESAPLTAWFVQKETCPRWPTAWSACKLNKESALPTP